ncbi:unnamed protein product [Arabis nemorensis]|uniref:Transmembrane protein n=1 Tax=Arabis nemorensis TaxID=586526 RepID=A0A565B403_9BRAS|nr:unnamed protein product [Arabis nemorensis]
MFITVVESSYGGGDEIHTPPSPSPSVHFDKPKMLPPPPNAATFLVCPQFTAATLISVLAFVF